MGVVCLRDTLEMDSKMVVSSCVPLLLWSVLVSLGDAEDCFVVVCLKSADPLQSDTSLA